MHFKTIIATVAALAVTFVVAGPVPEVNQDIGVVARREALVAEPINAPIAARDDQKLSAQKLDDIRQAALAFANAHAGQAPTSDQFAQMYNFHHSHAGLSIWYSSYGNWNWPRGPWPQPIPQVCPSWGFWPWFAYYCYSYWPSHYSTWVDWHDDSDCLLGVLCL